MIIVVIIDTRAYVNARATTDQNNKKYQTLSPLSLLTLEIRTAIWSWRREKERGCMHHLSCSLPISHGCALILSLFFREKNSALFIVFSIDDSLAVQSEEASLLKERYSVAVPFHGIFLFLFLLFKVQTNKGLIHPLLLGKSAITSPQKKPNLKYFFFKF
jgi:hypothetical protein